jgi:signal transduction histidine kinase
MLAAKAIEKSIEFVISKDTDVLINGDERKLKQVLINLINNAIKFTPENGKIGLKVSTNAGNYISIFIEDNGYGISEDEIEDVMRPFGRAYHSVTKSIEGTGLGLPLSKSIIELHGGELKIAGNNNKAGTTVEIRLPKTRLRQCA